VAHPSDVPVAGRVNALRGNAYDRTVIDNHRTVINPVMHRVVDTVHGRDLLHDDIGSPGGLYGHAET
jgi:hypothetical protein